MSTVLLFYLLNLLNLLWQILWFWLPERPSQLKLSTCQQREGWKVELHNPERCPAPSLVPPIDILSLPTNVVCYVYYWRGIV